MNLIERYTQYNAAKDFNSADIKGVINIHGYSFDIRLVNGELYANGLLLKDFLTEAMLSIEEELIYEEEVYKWLCSIANFQVA